MCPWNFGELLHIAYVKGIEREFVELTIFSYVMFNKYKMLWIGGLDDVEKIHLMLKLFDEFVHINPC